MEALLLLGVLGGFAVLRSGRIWPGLALLAATPLVHPNGVWFLAGGAAWVWLWARRRHGLPRPGAFGVAAVLCVALAWLAFAALVAAHPEAFAQGFAYQLARKAGAARLELLGDGRLLALAALLLLAHRLRREVPDAVLLACLAVPALLAHSVGQEYWYEVFEELFYLLLSVLALAAAGLWLARRPVLARHSALATAGVLALLLLANLAAHRVPNPLGFPGNLVWHRMRVSDGEPYLRADERAFLRGFLTRLAPPGALPRVRFHPAAEALFYADLDGVEIRVSEPVFREQQPDWLLVRTSRWARTRSFARELLARAGIDPGGPGAQRSSSAAGRERWYAIGARGRRPADSVGPAVEAIDGVDRRLVAAHERRDRAVHHLMLGELRFSGEGRPGDLDLEVAGAGRAHPGAGSRQLRLDRGAQLFGHRSRVRGRAQDLEGHGAPRGRPPPGRAG